MNFYVPTTWRKQFSGRFNKICFLTGVHKIFWLVSGSVLNYYLNWYMRGSVQIFHPQKICSCQKFTGHQKTVCFFSQLNEMYSNGLACLLQWSSIRSYIIDVFYNPRLAQMRMYCVVKLIVIKNFSMRHTFANTFIMTDVHLANP